MRAPNVAVGRLHPRIVAIENARRLMLAQCGEQYRTLAVGLGTFMHPIEESVRKLGRFCSTLPYVPDRDFARVRGLKPGTEPFQEPTAIVTGGGDCEDLNLYLLGNLALFCCDSSVHQLASLYVFDAQHRPRHVTFLLDSSGHDATPRGIGLGATMWGPGGHVVIPWA